MDCQSFDQHLLDALYDELDGPTRAELERHMAGCARCEGVYASLKATREVAVLPLEEPSDDLERRILDAAILAQRRIPLGKRVVRALAWAGSQAMRREFAMAAVAVLVLGSSLALLRAKPGTLASSPVRVREYGAPAPDDGNGEEARGAAPEAAPPPAAATASPDYGSAPRTDGPAERAQAAKAGARDKTDGEQTEGPAKGDDARSALATAREARSRGGCTEAVGRLNEVAARFPGTGAAADAMWEAAGCYRSMGENDRARELYLSLRQTNAYRERAEQKLASFEAGVANQQMNQMAGRPAAAAAQRSAVGAAAGPAGGAAAAASPVQAAAPPRATDSRDADLGNTAAERRGAPAGRVKAAAPAKKAAPPASAVGF